MTTPNILKCPSCGLYDCRAGESWDADAPDPQDPFGPSVYTKLTTYFCSPCCLTFSLHEPPDDETPD